MRSLLRVAVSAALAVTLSACSTWALTESELTWRIVAPERVGRAADFSFHVEARTKDGAEARGLLYRYALDWNGVKGSRHKAETFGQEQIRVKGLPGKTLLRIYAYDSNDVLHQVGQQEFEVY